MKSPNEIINELNRPLSKTEWSKYGYSLNRDAVPVDRKKSRYREYNVYTADAVHLKKKSSPPKILDIADEKIIAQCLYVLNKSCKRQRDAGTSFYNNAMHGFARVAAGRKSDQYQLKDQILKKLQEENRLTFVGIHKQKTTTIKRVKIRHEEDCCCYYCDLYDEGNRHERGFDWVARNVTSDNYLVCFEFCGFKFHQPIESSEINGREVKDLGKWISSSQQDESIKIKIKDAIATLQEFFK